MKVEQKIKIIKLVIVGSIVIIISLIFKFSKITSINEIIYLINTSGKVGIIAYILLFTFLPTFFMPVTVLAISAGVVFGLWQACLYTFIGSFLNSTLTFVISKYFAYDLVNDYAINKYSVEYEKLKENTKGKKGFILILVLRLLPIAPFTLLNYLSGAVGCDYKTFITSTLLGIIPGMFCYTNIGANAILGFSSQLVISISILLVFLILTTVIARKYYYKINYEEKKEMIGARNVIKGKVKEIKKGAVNGIVKVDVGEGIVISSNCSMESIEQLGLTEGKEVQVVIKAMGVMLANEKLNIGARNQVEGTVFEVKKGAINCIVKLKTNGGLVVTANLSLESVEELGIKEGQKAVAIFKAMNVLLMV